ncbi:hypothetical protein Ahu01nite_041370 [Winogradskya humida]|uniref:Uncharacterized protein n=1 Tax=Winogradskya humida TaxID=113566 RepID=A0ABQ3ZR25_9ACTN|nr:hypothetical protein Ahu01nite_041370 [Actinoplanes humidus]
MPDGDQFGELFVGPAPGVVATARARLVEKLREALGAPAIQEIELHRGHPPSLVTDPPTTVSAGATEMADRWSTTGRTRTNA